MEENKKKFLIKMILFLLFSLIIPAIYLTVRFDLFSQTTTIQLSIWAIVLLVIMLSVFVVMIKYWLSGLKTKFSLLKQLAMGFVKVIAPLIVILIFAFFLKNKSDILVANMGAVIEVLLVMIASETIAIIINPLPKWAFDNNVDGLGEIVDKVLSKKGE